MRRVAELNRPRWRQYRDLVLGLDHGIERPGLQQLAVAKQAHEAMQFAAHIQHLVAHAG